MKTFNKPPQQTLSFFCALLVTTGLALTASHPPNQITTSAELHSTFKTLSPYTPEGEAYFSKLCDSPKFYELLNQLQKSKSPNTAESYTNLATYFSLAAWDQDAPEAQTRYYNLADTAYNNALKISPNHTDAWIGKAELYSYSEHPESIKYAIQILQHLSASETSLDVYRSNYIKSLSKKLNVLTKGEGK
ncbi:hypothetical protein [Rubritalea tangerina]|uniref:Tetratricopeptide repeat protein n=1 Tax=Rubritalea tangerina TaxID=430798 RepID=A0ABW4ZAW5_9BACT